jgi:ribosomal protein L11 methyltransferase
MTYCAVHITCAAEEGEILIALLADEEFDSFEETATGITAYIQQAHFNETQVAGMLNAHMGKPVPFTTDILPEKNWNEEWEKHFDPVVINAQCRIRAPFHKSDSSFKHEVIIQPKMSFGTGHHSTTRLMMQRMLQLNHQDKTVLDFGSGTGVLAILAAQLHANVIDVVDNDEWAFENAQENFELNGVMAQIGSQTTHINHIGHTQYDIILANINKNILLEYMSSLSALMKPSACLLLSGFFEQDAEEINTSGKQNGLSCEGMQTENNWAIVTLTK